MLSCITSASLESLKDSTESFILNWQDQIRSHGSLVKTERHSPEELKKTLLENDMSSNSNLQAVKDQADQICSCQDTERSCVKYSNLILSASANYDAQLTLSSSKVF